MALVFATHNKHKVEEVQALLAVTGGPPLALTTLADHGFTDDPPETCDTFEGNALQKARYVHERLGIVAIADDSGLEVDALGGAPGVRSKRFSPEQTADANNRLLLERMAGVVDRRARFRCVLAVVGPGGERTSDGRCEGFVGTELRGAHGFGYDPLFWPDDVPGRTLAELPLEEKNLVSHRARAFARLHAMLVAIGARQNS